MTETEKHLAERVPLMAKPRGLDDYAEDIKYVRDCLATLRDNLADLPDADRGSLVSRCARTARTPEGFLDSAFDEVDMLLAHARDAQEARND